MYLPEPLAERDITKIHDFIVQNSFGILVLSNGIASEANHIPFEIIKDGSEFGALRGHVSVRNEAWKIAKENTNALVIFQGAHGYISPALHPSRKTHGKVAPSWNYAAVHVYGQVRVIRDPQWLLEHITRLTENNEKGRENQWAVEEAPSDFVKGSARHIVGLEISIDSFQGKFQASQQYKESTRSSIVDGILAENNDGAEALATMIKSRKSLRGPD